LTIGTLSRNHVTFGHLNSYPLHIGLLLLYAIVRLTHKVTKVPLVWLAREIEVWSHAGDLSAIPH
jgi:hypothetical protein